MRLCPICEKRPAKRSCPALGGSICPVCCARERMIKLKCPESCEYLQSARKSTLEKVLEERIRFVEQKGIPHNEKLIKDIEVIVIFEGAVVEAQRMDFQSLKDQDIAEGLDTSIKTLSTFESGLLYTHHAESAAGQAVAESILKTVELIQQEADPARVPKPPEIIRLLKLYRLFVDFHLRRGDDGRDYLRFASLLFPYPEEEKKSLIIAP